MDSGNFNLYDMGAYEGQVISGSLTILLPLSWIRWEKTQTGV